MSTPSTESARGLAGDTGGTIKSQNRTPLLIDANREGVRHAD